MHRFPLAGIAAHIAAGPAYQRTTASFPQAVFAHSARGRFLFFQARVRLDRATQGPGHRTGAFFPFITIVSPARGGEAKILLGLPSFVCLGAEFGDCGNRFPDESDHAVRLDGADDPGIPPEFGGRAQHFLVTHCILHAKCEGRL